MHLNEINKNETNLGFWAKPAYARPRRCVRMHEPAYITLPRNAASKHQSNLI